MPTIATRVIEWDAGHRIVGHESKCAMLHGHRYRAELHAQAEQAELDELGRVVDFSVLKERIGGWVDENWDHRTILYSQDALAGLRSHLRVMAESVVLLAVNPTAENLAAHLLRQSNELLRGTGVRLVSIRLWETPNCYVDVYP